MSARRLRQEGLDPFGGAWTPRGILPSVVVVDDHPALSQGLVALLPRRGVEVLGCARSAVEGEQLIRSLRPKAAIVDLELPDEWGAGLAARLHEALPELKIVVYTGRTDATAIRQALDSGADAVVGKPGDLARLLEAVGRVCQGQPYVDPDLATVVEAQAPDAKPLLSRRETEVLALLAKGMNGEEVAERLVLSPETIRTHVRNAMRKLDAQTRAQAIVAALQRGEIH